MKQERKSYVDLSKKNLARCWNWVEANPVHPLSKAYRSACYGLGGFDEAAIRKTMPGGEADANFRKWMTAYRRCSAAADLGFEYRDTIGRLILIVSAKAAAAASETRQTSDSMRKEPAEKPHQPS